MLPCTALYLLIRVTFSTPTGDYTQNPDNDYPGQGSQVKSAFAKDSICDRLTFAMASRRNRTAHRRRRGKGSTSADRHHDSPFSAVEFVEQNSQKTGIIRDVDGKQRQVFSAAQTVWRRDCDSNSHYRFESRNRRRLRNLQAVQHLTRESTSSDWPLCRLRTVHLFVRSLRRTAYDSVAESGHLRAFARDRHWVRDDYLLGRAVQTKKSRRSACRKKGK